MNIRNTNPLEQKVFINEEYNFFQLVPGTRYVLGLFGTEDGASSWNIGACLDGTTEATANATYIEYEKCVNTSSLQFFEAVTPPSGIVLARLNGSAGTEAMYFTFKKVVP